MTGPFEGGGSEPPPVDPPPTPEEAVLAIYAVSTSIIEGAVGEFEVRRTGNPALDVSAMVLGSDAADIVVQPQYEYQWRRNGVDIDGATAKTYVITSADRGNPLRLAVTTRNTAGVTTALSNTINVPA
jgi:hypothetical protein